jgi:NADH-quinone oxidoreductase subunit J
MLDARCWIANNWPQELRISSPMDWIEQYGLDILALVLVAKGVWWLMPRPERRPKIVGIALALVGLVLGAVRLKAASGPPVEAVLFSLCALVAVLGAILMITNRNPVYSALWFALVTLSVCGLFVLQAAPFLAAATVIVYAGAIVVMFVFVIMLAQQSGATIYDQRARQPFVATVATFFFVAMLLGTLAQVNPDDGGAGSDRAVAASARAANPFSRAEKGASIVTLRSLGRSLFGDYLFAVELAGTLLLVATIGAIAIAPRRRRGTL